MGSNPTLSAHPRKTQRTLAYDTPWGTKRGFVRSDVLTSAAPVTVPPKESHV